LIRDRWGIQRSNNCVSFRDGCQRLAIGFA
jgi:hypothetical protein